MGEKAGNFLANIHDSGYLAKYREPQLNSCTLINTSGREAESLNGRWNFTAD